MNDLLACGKKSKGEPEDILRRIEAAHPLQSHDRVCDCWRLLVQIVTQVFPFLEIPNWVVRLVIALAAIGFPIALVSAWAFELTPEGIKQTEDVDAALATKVGAAQKRSRSQAWIYIALVGAAVSTGLFFIGRHTASHGSASRQDASPARTQAGTAKSIAVLPFANMSADKIDE